MKALLLAACVMALPFHALSAIRVVTTLPEFADFTREIGKDKVQVDAIIRGDQNPHFVEVKPSYMMKLKSANLLFMVGMDLEMWVPQIVDGSRNSSLVVVDLSRDIQKLEVPSRVDASQGDVHRYGNPHYWLDPRNVRTIVGEIVNALVSVSPGDEAFFRANAEAYVKTVEARSAEWAQMMKPFSGSKIITFHKSWSYFANWLGLDVVDQIEPKPGIVPTPSHTADLIALVRRGGIKAIVVEPFYDLSAPDQIARASGAKVLVLPTSIGAVDGTNDYLSLMDYDVRTLAAALR